MSGETRWLVEIDIAEYEEERETRAEARLRTDEGAYLTGSGVAHRNPADPEVPEIGDELAAARALSDLAQRLKETTAGDIEEVTHEPVEHLS